MKDSFPAAGERFLPDTEATWELGEELGEALEAGDLVVLRGPLGAGKTTITQGIARGMETLASICSKHGTDPTGEHCRGMEGLVAEARKHAIETDFGDEDTQDAAIIAQYQRLAHYAITGYGTLKAWAAQLGLADAERLLDQTLQEETATDEILTGLAETVINAAAQG